MAHFLIHVVDIRCRSASAFPEGNEQEGNRRTSIAMAVYLEYCQIRLQVLGRLVYLVGAVSHPPRTSVHSNDTCIQQAYGADTFQAPNESKLERHADIRRLG